jgi:hypothetical protein
MCNNSSCGFGAPERTLLFTCEGDGDSWYKCDDEKITVVPLSKVLVEKAYVLFYNKTRHCGDKVDFESVLDLRFPRPHEFGSEFGPFGDASDTDEFQGESRESDVDNEYSDEYSDVRKEQYNIVKACLDGVIEKWISIEDILSFEQQIDRIQLESGCIIDIDQISHVFDLLDDCGDILFCATNSNRFNLLTKLGAFEPHVLQIGSYGEHTIKLSFKNLPLSITRKELFHSWWGFLFMNRDDISIPKDFQGLRDWVGPCYII